MSNAPEIVESLVSLDGMNRWKLTRRPDGLYSYCEETFYRELHYAAEYGNKSNSEFIEYWTPTRFSGLFDTVEAAQHDALDKLPWFFEALTSISDGS